MSPNKMKIIPFIILIVFIICLVGFGIQVIWNTVVVEILDVRSITFLQSLGLYALCQLLFTAHHFKNDK